MIVFGNTKSAAGTAQEGTTTNDIGNGLGLLRRWSKISRLQREGTRLRLPDDLDCDQVGLQKDLQKDTGLTVR